MRMAAAAAIIPEPEPGAEGPEQRRASAAPWPCTWPFALHPKSTPVVLWRSLAGTWEAVQARDHELYELIFFIMQDFSTYSWKTSSLILPRHKLNTSFVSKCTLVSAIGDVFRRLGDVFRRHGHLKVLKLK
jgi:hypothetical protein